MEIDEAKLAEIIGTTVQKVVAPLVERIQSLESGNGNNDDQNHNGDGKDGITCLDDIIKENEERQKTFAARLSTACQSYGKDDKFTGKSL